jgi:hypothetical protein
MKSGGWGYERRICLIAAFLQSDLNVDFQWFIRFNAYL